MKMTKGERLVAEMLGDMPVLTKEHPFLRKVVAFMQTRKEWLGTATDLLNANEATADLSYKSIIEQLYLNFPFGCRIYVKSVHHTLFLQSIVNFWFKRLSKILFFLPAL